MTVTAAYTQLGREAHAAGMDRIPFLDPTIEAAIRDLPVGGGAAGIFRAWLTGWDTANLAARVTALDTCPGCGEPMADGDSRVFDSVRVSGRWHDTCGEDAKY